MHCIKTYKFIKKGTKMYRMESNLSQNFFPMLFTNYQINFMVIIKINKDIQKYVNSSVIV